MRLARIALSILLIAGSAVAVPAQESLPAPPRWMSIGAGRALMRAGPARTYPGVWLYQRVDLPLQVVGTFKEWRRVRDQDGAEGWMLVNLLRRTRTAVVRSDAPAAMRAAPAGTATLAWRAAPGVVGRISQCGNGWCRFDVQGKAGFVETADLWGVDPGESLP
jgi:SH3-like domain-containing protein